MHFVVSLAWRSLRSRPSRALFTLFAIVLGVGVILAVDIANGSTLDSVTALFNETSGKAHLTIVSSSDVSSGYSESALRKVAASPGIQVAVPVLQVQALLAETAGPTKFDANGMGVIFDGLTIYGIDAALDREARAYTIVDGQFLQPGSDLYEVVLVKDYADTKKLRVGSDLKIMTAYGPEALRVIGLMSKEGAGQLGNGAFGVAPLKVMQTLFNRSGELDEIDIVARPEAATVDGLESLKNDLQARLGDKYSVIYPASRGQRVTQMLSTYQLGLNFFGAVSLFVGGFLIYNAFSMTIVERTREIGMLRTIGMMRRQVLGQILTEAAILGAAGSVLGIGAGVVISQGLIRVMELMYAQNVRQVRIPTAGLLTSIGVGLSVTLLATLIPAWQAARISPLEALRVRSRSGADWFSRQGWGVGLVLLVSSFLVLYFSPFSSTVGYVSGSAGVLGMFFGATLLIPRSVGIWERATRLAIRRIYGNEGRLGSSNIQRAQTRTALTVAALLVGVAMVLAIRSTTAAFAGDIRAWIDKYVGGDLFVNASVPMDARTLPRLAAVQGVATVTPLRYFLAKWQANEAEDVTVTYMAIDPDSYQQVTTVSFAAGQGDPKGLMAELGQGDAVFISNVLAEKYKIRRGDTIRLSTRRGVTDFRVAAIAVNFQDQGKVIMGSWRDMRRYFGISTISVFLIKTLPGVAPETVRDTIRDLYHQGQLTVDTNQVLKQQAMDMMDQAFGLFNVLVLIAMLVAALGVVNTLSMSVLERTREIGMLRGLGMTRRQVARMILAEAGMMGLMGGVLGLAYGLVLSAVFIRGTAAVSGYELNFVLPVEGLIFGLLVSLVVSQIAALGPARRAARTRIVEAIQFE